MSWIEVKACFAETPLDWSIYVDVFARHGCEHTLQEDEPATLSSAVVEVDGADGVVRALSNDLLMIGASTVETRSLVEENWEEHWKRFFHPRKVGNRFVIAPSWERAPSEMLDGDGRIEITLDPGQAFGTGDHPTTRMCLELMERTSIEGVQVADIGCGSGILSIGAGKLGAGKVIALDIEPLSVEVAKANGVLNGVEYEAVVGKGIAPLSGPFGLVLSNLISAALIPLVGDVYRALEPEGRWIVSGIIVQNWLDVLVAAEEGGFALVDKLEEDGWVAATLSKRSA